MILDWNVLFTIVPIIALSDQEKNIFPFFFSKRFTSLCCKKMEGIVGIQHFLSLTDGEIFHIFHKIKVVYIIDTIVNRTWLSLNRGLIEITTTVPVRDVCRCTLYISILKHWFYLIDK